MHLEKLENLEELKFTRYKYRDFYIKDAEDLESFRSVLNAPKFSKFNDIVISKPVSEEDCISIAMEYGYTT